MSDTEEPLAKRRSVRVRKITSPAFHYEEKWTYADKQELYNALLKHGSSNLEILQSYLPNKSIDSIKTYIMNIKRTARANIKDDKNVERIAPIDKWLEFVIKKDSENPKFVSDVAIALKFVALFEPRIENQLSDVEKCYQVLSDCLKGEAPRHLNSANSYFLLENVQKMARVVKSENLEAEQRFIQSLGQPKEVKRYSAKTPKNFLKNSGLNNPLKVPDSLLVFKN